MRKLLVLGAGTAGTMAANKLWERLDPRAWTITVIDQDDQHHVQPGCLFIPFGVYDRNDLAAPETRGPLRRGRGHHQRLRPHREDRRRPAAGHLSRKATNKSTRRPR